ncbi:ADP-ribosylglycohydrolase family protein [uncultured Selenomonas sp.]|uniref:ADP-ribosylglycohydrolase family protein n=1 Tax=uncultured Selenomonas sp. TaxID=159275 RepID=UPI0028DCE08F|nr:ADP-ribosylglycohydrolase family protein [uncultured Selenomonas sp.]
MLVYGAILGDIIGSPYEFDRGEKTKEFELFPAHARFTDDTVMTIAVAEALIGLGVDADEEHVKADVVRFMRHWGRNYLLVGYGGLFRKWLVTDDPQPYSSFGNGAAMRASSVGWLYDSLSRTREVARWTAEVTHNHPEGVKGAETVASAIYLGRMGHSKEEIKAYITQEFGYDLTRTLDEIRPTYSMDATCPGSVPEAIIAFLESTDVIDAIRNAVSLGGDTDTTACIAGGIAEGFYGRTKAMESACENLLPEAMREVLYAFEAVREVGVEEIEKKTSQ